MSGELSRFMAAIRSVESHGDYDAMGVRTAYGRATGAYQFIDATWDGYGGYRSAHLAPKKVQDERARQLMSDYYKEFRSWELVAVAWHAGRGSARKVMRDPAYLRGLTDGYLGTAQYVDRVMGLMRTVEMEKPKPKHDLRPWRVPQIQVGRAGRIIVNPGLLLSMIKRMTEHLAIAEEVFHRCHDAREDVGRLRLADPAKTRKIQDALDEALEAPDGLRRLPRLLSKDIGYVVEARDRAMGADGDHQAHQRHTIERIIASLNGGHDRSHDGVAKEHVRDLLRDLFRIDTRDAPSSGK